MVRPVPASLAERRRQLGCTLCSSRLGARLINLSIQWLTYAPVANTSAFFFSTTLTAINWLVVGFFFAFVIASPFAFYALNESGPKLSIVTSSILLLLGNWIRYGGTRASHPSFAAVMVGQVLIGFAQPFVLAAPTAYSALWFTARGRTSATAITTLANPLGAAIGQLVGPLLVGQPSDITPLTLYVAIITSVATIPSLFIAAAPPTPVAASSSLARPPIQRQLNTLMRSTTFWLTLIPFSVYVGFFNSFSSLLTQMLTPYGFSEIDSGIAGAVLILVGLAAAAIVSPIIDRTKRYLLIIKILVPVLAVGYLVFIFAPPSRSIAAPCVICAFIGAASFALVPTVLEFLVEVTWPVGPELTSVICWTGGQLFGGIFTLISNALVDGPDGNPPRNMQRALIFQAVVAIAAAPAGLALGVIGRAKNRRLEVDKGVSQGHGVGVDVPARAGAAN